MTPSERNGAENNAKNNGQIILLLLLLIVKLYLEMLTTILKGVRADLMDSYQATSPAAVSNTSFYAQGGFLPKPSILQESERPKFFESVLVKCD